MKKFIILFLFIPFFTNAQKGYYFFTNEDLKILENNSKTEFGKRIIEGLKQKVNDRRKHSLRVPLMEGGHLHHYFCPKHNVFFEFDWDSPYSHYCGHCKEFWENNNSFDWAWINRVHAENLNYLTASMYLYLITKDTLYAAYIRDMMLDYSSKYPTYMEHNTNRIANAAWGGRMFGQSLDEAVWASESARAYFIAKQVMTENQVKKIENGYLKICAQMLLNRKGSNNWQVWHNSGLIALGVALQNDSIIDIALNDPRCGYYNLMKQYVKNDGWWNEGSPIYHYYPLRAMLLSADALRCRNINLFDKKLYSMFASPALGVYSNLFFPAHNDGWYGESLTEQAGLYEIAYMRYSKDPFFFNILEQTYRHTERNFVESLLNDENIKPASKIHAIPSVCFENIGVAVLRSGEKTAVLKYGIHGGGHGHPDKLSITVHNGKKELVTDMGTPAYGLLDYKQWYRKTLSHSTLTVDAKDQCETEGKLLSFKTYADGAFVECESAEAYHGVYMKRSLNFAKNLLTDFFTASSKDLHQYDYVLIFNEKPDFSYSTEKTFLDDAPVYKRISNVQKINAKKFINLLFSDGTRIKIQPLKSSNFEIFIGEAPGIPPRNTAIDKAQILNLCYPLIIRVKDKNIKIKTDWKFLN
ncbi:MAG: heparinase II/III-family protein [Prevotellaceae bacterium]|jgi:hypothetical protein|nr:heparinase II/III-family protein [Prevotellaceae bacterium]